MAAKQVSRQYYKQEMSFIKDSTSGLTGYFIVHMNPCPYESTPLNNTPSRGRLSSPPRWIVGRLPSSKLNLKNRETAMHFSQISFL